MVCNMSVTLFRPTTKLITLCIFRWSSFPPPHYLPCDSLICAIVTCRHRPDCGILYNWNGMHHMTAGDGTSVNLSNSLVCYLEVFHCIFLISHLQFYSSRDKFSVVTLSKAWIRHTRIYNLTKTHKKSSVVKHPLVWQNSQAKIHGFLATC